MQDIKQLTRSFGAALQLAPEYTRYVAAMEAHEADEALTAQMRELDLLRLQYKLETAKKDDADAALLEGYNRRFTALYDAIMDNPVMLEQREAAEELNALLQWITGFIQGCAQGEDPASYEPVQESGCGGKCGGCSGCGS